MNALSKLALAIAIALPTSVVVAQNNDHGAHHAPTSNIHTGLTATSTSTVAEAQMSEGEVRKINKDAKKITIKHGELKNLDMPAMTMVFQVKDPSMLDKVKQGDKVSFVAEKVGGQFTITQIEAKQ